MVNFLEFMQIQFVSISGHAIINMYAINVFLIDLTKLSMFVKFYLCLSYPGAKYSGVG